MPELQPVAGLLVHGDQLRQLFEGNDTFALDGALGTPDEVGLRLVVNEFLGPRLDSETAVRKLVSQLRR